MAARKLQQEIDKCFKKVSEGVASFETIHEKILQTTNASQKEKLEDALKKEIKKLQRSRDQIKTWTASSEIKDKSALLDTRKLIETQMEKFKAVEKEMKTKAYSKEGLQAAAKLDPKEREKVETCDFLSRMIDELERQVEQLETEIEHVGAGMKKGKKDNAKAERIAELEQITEQHKFHQGKLELIWRTLENGGLEVDQVKDLEEDIQYYVESNQEADFVENDTLYDDLNLQDEEDLYGMTNETDRLSSQDAQSLADETLDGDSRPVGTVVGKPKSSSISESSGLTRRPSTQLKSPLPALATLHTPLTTAATASSVLSAKPAPLPTRAPGEPLKYASAAAAAAASDKSGLGLGALPPPPGIGVGIPLSTGLSPLPSIVTARAVAATTSPSTVHSQLSASSITQHQQQLHMQLQQQSPLASPQANKASAAPQLAAGAPESATLDDGELSKTQSAEEERRKLADAVRGADDVIPPSTPALTNGDTHSEVEEESIYHLPSSLQDLLESFEAARASTFPALATPSSQRLFIASGKNYPDSLDAERPQHYRPQNPYPYTPAHYPQEPLSVFDDGRLYGRCDTDTLFYSFYYKQGTYQQYCSAKALKGQSWRFHKQYQTWFQRHEEPKSITEDYEQGTYRFFDYESTWMNRRKADFKFHYKYLEDDL